MLNINPYKGRTFLLDLDGTLVYHNYDPEEIPDRIISENLDNLLSIIDLENDAVIILTSRNMTHTKLAYDLLTQNGLRIHKVFCNIPTGKRILFNDYKYDGEFKAISINFKRNGDFKEDDNFSSL